MESVTRIAMKLILARCGDDPALFGDVPALGEGDDQRLLDGCREGHGSLAEPLTNGRLAIGKREGSRLTWWLTPPDLLLEPPHALWLVPELFQPEGEGQQPHTLDVRALWKGLPPDPAWGPLLGAVVEALRNREPVVVKVDVHAEEGLAVLLAWLVGRIAERADGMRSPWSMSIGPTSRQCDVRFNGVGARVIDVDDPPAVTDPVAAWIRDHLSPDPKLLYVPGGIHRAWVAERSRTDRGERLASKLGAQAPLEELVEDLVDHTLATGDPEPWEALKRRPAVIREKAVLALLERTDDLQPERPLLDALDGIYPRGAKLAPWCAALLAWLRTTQDPEAVLITMATALLDWPQNTAATLRTSIWTEAVRVLVHRRRFDLARFAIVGTVANWILDDGNAAALATMWASLPRKEQRPDELDILLVRFSRHEAGDEGVAQLARHLIGSPSDIERLIEHWLAARGPKAVVHADRLRSTLWNTTHRKMWLLHAVTAYGEDIVAPLLDDASPSDPIWVEFEAAAAVDRNALERIHRMRTMSEGKLALVPVARGLLPDALEVASFPDMALARVASSFLGVPGASVVWAWLAVAAAPPAAYPDDMIDGTIVDLCNDPPRDQERQLCALIAERLALAEQWTPLDHARWIVRFALAPDGDFTGFNDRMASLLLAAMAQRPDASEHLAELVGHMLELDPKHPALQALFFRWLPEVWTQPPSEFLVRVQRRGVPPQLQPAWGALAHR